MKVWIVEERIDGFRWDRVAVFASEQDGHFFMSLCRTERELRAVAEDVMTCRPMAGIDTGDAQ